MRRHWGLYRDRSKLREQIAKHPLAGLPSEFPDKLVRSFWTRRSAERWRIGVLLVDEYMRSADEEPLPLYVGRVA